MRGASLVFDNQGINGLSIVGKAKTHSILYLNRKHGEEIELEFVPVNLNEAWKHGRGGVYGLMDLVLEQFQHRYSSAPRVLAVGEAALTTDSGGICSAPVKNDKNSYIDTWAGRGGFGSKTLQEHGIAAIIYGGSFIDEDFRDRNVANQWFEEKYNKKLAAKDLEATTKYRFDRNFDTGGTFGVNYSTSFGRTIFMNYRSVYMSENERIDIHKRFILDHYLKQFNEETIKTKSQFNCGEPCAAVCKKTKDEFKKDYEPYQTLRPLSAIFDQRAAEKLNHHSDALGFDAISIGSVVAWIFECLDKNLLTPDEVGVSEKPKFSLENFNIVEDSMHNANLSCELLDSIVQKRGIMDFSEGSRKWGRRVSRQKGKSLLDLFVYNAFARNGWMVPNQYWTPGALSPLPINGKYFMYYGNDFLEPRTLGQICAERTKAEFVLDNFGFCRFHRNCAEDMLPEIAESLWGIKEPFLERVRLTASRVACRNASVFHESERNINVIHSFLKRKKEVDKLDSPDFVK